MKIKYLFILLPALFLLLTSESGCNDNAVSTSGVTKAKIDHVQTNTKGLTVEQDHCQRRIEEDNKPGAIKHLYIISAYSGQVLLYSTVEGKVTSSSKRLSPSSASGEGTGFRVDLTNDGSNYFYTKEVLGDDGTYGSSGEYIYWWDSKKVYHQTYITGGLLVTVSDQPLAVKSVVINVESTTASAEPTTK